MKVKEFIERAIKKVNGRKKKVVTRIWCAIDQEIPIQLNAEGGWWQKKSREFLR